MGWFSGREPSKNLTLKLHSVTYSLLYPAVLGSMLMAILYNVTLDSFLCDPLGYVFALFLAVYFSSQHVQNEVDYAGFTPSMFVFDLVEIVLFFGAFGMLGMH